MSLIDKPLLIADDDINVLSAISLQLKCEGYSSRAVQSPQDVLDNLKLAEYGLILMDLNYHSDTTSGQEGLTLISAIRKLDKNIPIVVMTGWGSIDIAVESMHRGANDFIEKPCDNNRLINIIRNLLALGESHQQSARLRSENQLLQTQQHPAQWICQSKAMQGVMDIVASVADSDINILITGENGTGKSQLAHIIHQASQRREQSLVAVNMGAINEQVFESEMFGHIKGAFTDAKTDRIGRVELAKAGTLFMDEIANIPLTQQPKLLKVLEDGQFERLGSSKSLQADIRVISATNGDLTHLVEQGEFRQDLLYRLNSIEIAMPSLRHRQEDIEPLAEQILQRYTRKYRRHVTAFSDSAKSKMKAYTWPGNVRELDHLIERATLMAKDSVIQAEDLLLPTSKSHNDEDSEWANMSLEQAERKLIVMALNKFKGNAKQAAQMLGYSKSAFYRRLEKFAL
ncbi:sigma-54 dependent transcriptional regulator [uncultured Paraglaciecola sp.]|uniref:sigma-54-dependent transcriptional regulator n=1 Tax=uncultured Paraglaciecola sp. TaxID=1765024 RepID=UPI0026102010|nr:sigma-54 dependent transcriptional regulator [uncultured Paraglaciecola sp.]